MDIHSIDIVIPTFRLREQLLLDIIHLPRPEGFPVFIYIIADNPGVKVPQSLQLLSETGSIVLLINSKNIGPAATRNIGIREGKSKWILFLDDDIKPEPDLLMVYAEAVISNPESIGFAGVTKFPPAFNAVTRALKINGTIDSFSEADRKALLVWAPTANVMLSREKLDKSLFDEALTTAEDIDLLTRCSLLYKEKYIALPRAIAHHPWWDNGAMQTKRMISYGRGASMLARKTPIRDYTYVDFTNTGETLLLLAIALPFAQAASFSHTIVIIMISVIISEYLTNWIKAIIKAKTWSPLVAFHMMWIKNCRELAFLYTSLTQGYLKGFARRIDMGFDKRHPSPLRLNRWKIIKLLLICIVIWLIHWGRT